MKIIEPQYVYVGQPDFVGEFIVIQKLKGKYALVEWDGFDDEVEIQYFLDDEVFATPEEATAVFMAETKRKKNGRNERSSK